MEQPNRFQKLVAEAKKNITEISPVEAKERLDHGAIAIDVREESDFREGHVAGAMHLSRGVIELEIEDEIPDLEQPIICYCGGGSRAALVTESLQKMGYKNVRSVAGGLRAWKAQGLPTT
ncbi:MAG: rhodanese-like domain-containing protein [Chthoniobacterales bacterium]